MTREQALMHTERALKAFADAVVDLDTARAVVAPADYESFWRAVGLEQVRLDAVLDTMAREINRQQREGH